MASRIRELKDAVGSQNEMIRTLRADKEKIHETVRGMYTAMVKYKPSFTNDASQVESEDYPDVKAEDMAKMADHELVTRFGLVMGAIIASLDANRREVHDLYKELDADVNSVMSSWQQLQIQDKNDKKAETFRSYTVSDATKARSKTPELGINSTGHYGPTLPPTPPDTAGKKEIRPQVTTSKSQSGTTTLDQMLSPTSKSSSKGKPTTNPTTAATGPSSTKK